MRKFLRFSFVAISILATATLSSQVFGQAVTWEYGTALPTVRANLAAGTIGNFIVAAGGVTTILPSPTGSTETDIFDLNTNTWTRGADMPFPIASVGSAAIGGNLYVAGGCCSGSGLEIYNLNSDTWSSGPSMPTFRSQLGAGTLGGLLYAAGGYDGTQIRGEVEVFDPSSQTWREAAPLGIPRTQLAVAAVGGLLYAVGGKAASANGQVGPPLATLEVYDPSTNTWSQKAPMAHPRSNLAAVGLDGLLYAIGGGGGIPDETVVEAYNPSTNTWSAVSPLLMPIEGLAATVARGTIFAIGGILSGQPPPVISLVETLGCPDADGDGLCDSWETSGVDVPVTDASGTHTVHVDLPGMGADPMHKDIFVYIDYMRAPDHTHSPKVDAIGMIVQAFAQAPVQNPDGKSGITLHVHGAPKGVLEVPILGFTQDVWTDFNTIKSAHFPQELSPIYHYALFAHQYSGPTGNCSSGISNFETAGVSDFIVSLGCFTGQVGSTWEQAGTFMHELGHNLGLHHGGRNYTGDDEEFYKPNYLSVMDYTFQMRGLIEADTTGNRPPGHFDYSRTKFPDLNEQQLDTRVGLNSVLATNYGTFHYCPGANPARNSTNGDRAIYVAFADGAIDWKCDGSVGILSNVDIDADSSSDNASGYHLLHGFDDWSNLIYRGGAIGSLGTVSSTDTAAASIQEITAQEDASIAPNFGVLVSGSRLSLATPNSTTSLTYTVTNRGFNADTYNITASSNLPWADFSKVPSVLSLAPGASSAVSMNVNVPSSASTGSTAQIILKAVSQTSALVLDSAEVDISASPAGVPAFTLTAFPASATVTSGLSATYMVDVSPVGNFTQSVAFTCSGGPTSSTCTITPNSVSPNGVNDVTATVTIQTPLRQAATWIPPGDHALDSQWAMLILSWLILLLSCAFWNTQRSRQVLRIGGVVALLVAASCLGCGSSSSGSGGGSIGTPPATYTLTITATSGTISQTATVTLVVN